MHILDENKKLSPSSFIPFCEFGGNMSALGVKIEQFKVPVCNSFKPKIFKNQLCYEIYSDEFNLNTKNKQGLLFVLDYNKEI